MLHPDISDEQVLDNAGIRVTAVRLLIWRKVRHEFSDAFSLADLEAALPTVDRSTIFRTLTLLSENHLLHDIDDGSGSQKYCVCHLDDTRQCFGHVHLMSPHLLSERRTHPLCPAACGFPDRRGRVCGEGHLSAM